MDSNTILVTALGLVASTGFIASNYAITRKWILGLQAVGLIGVGSMFAVRAISEDMPSFWGVTVVNALFLTRNIWLYFREKFVGEAGLSNKERLSTMWIFMIIILSTYLIVTPNPLNNPSLFTISIFILPLLAAVTNVLGIGQAKIVSLKWFILISVCSWLAFDIVVGAWQTMIGDAFSAIALIISLYRLKKQRYYQLSSDNK